MLAKFIVQDAKLQAYTNIYGFTVLTTVMFSAVLWLMPDNVSDELVAMILFMDPAVIGASFVGAMVLMERSQNTLVVIGVSPAKPYVYVLSKVITLTLLTFASGMGVVAAGIPLTTDLVVRFISAMALTGSVAVLTGTLLVATANTFNHLLVRLFPLTVVLYLAFIPHYDVVTGPAAWAFAVLPSHAMLKLLLWGADPANVTTAELVYSFTYLIVLLAVFYVWALHLYAKHISRSDM